MFLFDGPRSARARSRVRWMAWGWPQAYATWRACGCVWWLPTPLGVEAQSWPHCSPGRRRPGTSAAAGSCAAAKVFNKLEISERPRLACGHYRSTALGSSLNKATIPRRRRTPTSAAYFNPGTRKARSPQARFFRYQENHYRIIMHFRLVRKWCWRYKHHSHVRKGLQRRVIAGGVLVAIAAAGFFLWRYASQRPKREALRSVTVTPDGATK